MNGLSCGEESMTIYSAVLTQYQRVTDRRTSSLYLLRASANTNIRLHLQMHIYILRQYRLQIDDKKAQYNSGRSRGGKMGCSLKPKNVRKPKTQRSEAENKKSGKRALPRQDPPHTRPPQTKPYTYIHLSIADHLFERKQI